jgi:sensor c-di-GMP phosphodiesterase-like protein
MKRTSSIAASLRITGIALMPVLISVYVAWSSSIRTERSDLIAKANTVANRTSKILSETVTELTSLEASGAFTCDGDSIRAMRASMLRLNYARSVGAINGSLIICTAHAHHSEASRMEGAPGSLGSPDWISSSKIRFWAGVDAVQFLEQQSSSQKFVVVATSNLFAAVGADQLVDASFPDTDLEVTVSMRPGAGDQRPRVLIHAGPDGNVPGKAFDHVSGDVADRDGMFYVRASIPEHPLQVVIGRPRSHFLDVLRGQLWGYGLIGLMIGGLLYGVVTAIFKRESSLYGQIKRGIRDAEFCNYYQPIIDMNTGRCIGAEALVRWRKPDGTMISPAVFISVAESNGIVKEITRQVIRNTIRDLGHLLSRRKELSVGINLSTDDLIDPTTLATIQDALRGTGVDPHQIKIEIVERAFANDQECREAVSRFRKAGHKVFIDDFGTGYSSLSYLQSFELDGLKIDKSFVDVIETETVTSGVIHHIIEMARTLGLDIVAEGVESEQQKEFLKKNGVMHGQGWHFSKAIPSTAFIRFVEKRKTPGNDTPRGDGTDRRRAPSSAKA